MAGFRKKRRNTGPSKNEEKVAREYRAEQSRQNAPTLGVAYPELMGLSIEGFFYYPANNLIDQRKLEVSPNDKTRLTFDCPGMCGGGKFELEDILEEAIEGRRERVELTIPCAEPSSRGECGCQLKLVGTLRFKPIPAA